MTGLLAERLRADADRPRLQFGVALDVGDGDPAAEGLHPAARLAGGDRQHMAEVRGRTWHHAQDHA
ncbi:hypothetical protein [Streptomyces sp. NBC_01367]|uniref:hypothetical protein n=1 Tax=Streptomyces sp. NBC_01367 TaxID=2903841 RepID=UPI00324E16CD